MTLKHISLSALVALLFSSFPDLTQSVSCPNLCDSHGRCDHLTQTCDCFDGYTGADCSLMICPFGPAWIDAPIDIDLAHNLAECSNMGVCDRNLGTCTCRAGFEGEACERTACPNSCSLRGKCVSMQYYATFKDPGVGTVFKYENIWDAYRIFGCMCDPGWYGPDCSLRDCPKGDDPMTGVGASTLTNPNQFNEVQRVSCSAAQGTFTLTFRGQTTVPIPFSASAETLTKALQDLTTISSVKIVLYGEKACMESGTTFTVEFLQEFGNLPSMIGDASMLSYSDGLRLPKLLISKQQVGTKENEYCSNRGICDSIGGFCACSNNFITSDGYNREGTRGDCGRANAAILFCPGTIACSAHGVCAGNPTFRCACDVGWTGAECGDRTCPTGTSWFNLPTADNVAHVSAWTECSDMGTCDRVSGSCQCIPNYGGAACNRLECPGGSSQCNGHGVCADMATIANLAASKQNSSKLVYGSVPNNPQTWDANKLFGCICNEGYSGYDCLSMDCPIGVDPEATVNELQTVTCTDTSATGVASNAILFFNITGVSVSTNSRSTYYTASVPAMATTDMVATTLSLIPGMGTVEVLTRDNFGPTICPLDGTSGSFLLAFVGLRGDLPPVSVTSSSPFLNLRVSESRKGSAVKSVCSNRGLCSTGTGRCNCFKGYDASDGNGNIGTIPDCGYRVRQEF